MSNQLEKLKNSIKKEYVKNFELNLMKSSGFIPVDKRQGKLYTIISQANLKNIDAIKATINNKIETYGIELIPVSNAIFDEVYDYISNLTDTVGASVKEEEKPAETLSAEDMMVSIGWLTKEQLRECADIANEKKLPLDAVFYDKGYLSYERIVSYLKKKYGCNVVSKSNIVYHSLGNKLSSSVIFSFAE